MQEETDKPFLIMGAGPTPSQGSARRPKEAVEGVSGQFLESGNLQIPLKRAVSLTKIRTLDLISEGEIEGLVNGEYNYVGNIGNVGYSSVSFNPYQTKSINGVSIPYLRSIYWNETPVVDKDNLFNFQQVDVSYSNGGPNGSSVVGIGDELTVSRNIQERLRGPNSNLDDRNKQQIIGEVEQFSKYYRILNKDCQGVSINVRINALSQTIIGGSKAGDTTSSNIFYRIYYKPLFNRSGSISVENAGPEEQEGYIFGKEEEINGKISFGYIRSSRIDFDSSYSSQPGFAGWAVKIFRLTPDSLQGSLRNQTYIDSLTEIYGNSYCYPNSSIVSQTFSAEYFSQIPSRAFDARLLKVKIPSNYNPITKNYQGHWDGSWREDSNGNESKFWTDNPAWCFYDLVTNKRYGLGKFVDESFIDKWTLYEIAQYCDTLVPDGLGGIEPRFTCNTIINSREEAYKIINDMASIFRAIVYYFAGGIYSSIDVAKDEIYQFTNSSVDNGNFNYSSSSKRVRHSVAIVRYNDKNNFYQPAVEYIEDAEAIKKYGYREFEASAFGCTSRGQAIRYGRWALLSEALETETISFEAGMESNYLRPGDVFKVFDRYKRNSRHGGRIYQASGDLNSSTIILDSAITGLQSGSLYNLSIITPTYNYNPSQVTNLNSDDINKIRRSQIQTISFSGQDTTLVEGKTKISLVKGASETLLNFESYSVNTNAVWMLESPSTLPSDSNFVDQWDYYRVIRVEEKDVNRYVINGLQYDVNKYSAIDSGLNFQNESVTAQTPSKPDGLFLTFGNLPNSTDLKGIKYVIQKNNFDGVNGFLVYARLGEWEKEDFSERFTDGSALRVVEETPDRRYLVNITDNINLTNYYVPLSNGSYYFRVYSRNVVGVPSNSSVSASITVSNLNSFQSLLISSLRIDGNQDTLITDKAEDLYETAEPSFRWQSSFENDGSSPYSIGDVSYRISIRKSTSPNSTNPATSEERVGTDPYQPSSVIYYQSINYLPEESNNPSFQFDLNSNISSVVNYYRNNGVEFTGVWRDYDVVVEAHLPNGDSSAGGNIFGGGRLGVTDSSFLPSRKKGWDILHVNNPNVPKITLTPNGELGACLTSQTSDLTQICTEQWINPDGTATFQIHTNNLPSDAVGGFVFSCRESFTQAEAHEGKKDNGVGISRFEFTNIDNPILSQTNLLGFRDGWLAISFYDSFDSSFRQEVLKSDPFYNDIFFKSLNMSDSVYVRSRGISEAQGRYIAWASIELTAQPHQDSPTSDPSNDARLDISNFSWVGAGVIDSYPENRFDFVIGTTSRPTAIYVTVKFDTEIVGGIIGLGHSVSFVYGHSPIESGGGKGTRQYFNNRKLLLNLDNIPSNTTNNRFKIIDLPENISVDSYTNDIITFKILIPHTIDAFGTITDFLSKEEVYAKIFVGLMANTFDGIHEGVLSDFQDL